MEETFWKKFKVLFSLGPIHRVIKIWIPSPRRSKIAWFLTSKVSKPRFSSKKPRSWRKVWTKNSEKKFQKFLSVVSIDPVSFQNFHWNHHKWENKTKIARIPNLRGGKLTPTNWPWKSADVVLFYGPPAIRIHMAVFPRKKLFFLSHSVLIQNLWNPLNK